MIESKGEGSQEEAPCALKREKAKERGHKKKRLVPLSERKQKRRVKRIELVYLKKEKSE
ncbi:hypothetical protein ACM26V_17065 [Salipaludibacillus sp. HK11]|uniref:hypothetical protein n=1 Tax=Salipaludibacillus sp. HK11 TaxID=3394320 RepID=UPI0039FD3BEB